MIPGASKTDIDNYFYQTKPHIKTLIKNQLKEMGSAKIIMTLWVRWKKPIKPFIGLGLEDLEDAQDIAGNAGDKGRPAPPVSTSLDEFEKEEMKKSKSGVKNKLNKWHDWLVDYVPKPIKNAAGKIFLTAKISILGLYDGVKNTLKGDVGNQKQTENNTDLTTHENEGGPGDGYTRVDMPFNSLATEFFEASDINDLIKSRLAYIRAQTENPKFHESGFSIDKTTHLYINFHRLALTRGGSYIEWING